MKNRCILHRRVIEMLFFTAGGFSAVCLLYAMELAPHVNRPIGLIEADWGGTPVEAWSSPDARSACSQRQKRYYIHMSADLTKGSFGHFNSSYVIKILKTS